VNICVVVQYMTMQMQTCVRGPGFQGSAPTQRALLCAGERIQSPAGDDDAAPVLRAGGPPQSVSEGMERIHI